jgi:4-methylaminobutanoate oxidase (formaldehyde-forming)
MIEADRPIDQSYLDGGEWTVEIGQSSHPARVSLRPMYDPANERIRS